MVKKINAFGRKNWLMVAIGAVIIFMGGVSATINRTKTLGNSVTDKLGGVS